MKKYLLLSLMINLQSSILLACSCVPITTFCETVSIANTIYEGTTVLQVEILEKKIDGIDIKIESVLLGTTSQQELFIQRGSGNDCTVDTNIFSEGEHYIFYLLETDSVQNLYLSYCGITYLKIENGIINGPIASGIKMISLDEFNSIECLENSIVSTSGISQLERSFLVFPNPTDGNFFILNTNEIEEKKSVEIEMIDLNGKIIYKAQKTEGWQPYEELRINVSEVVPGIYFLKIFKEQQSVIFKVVKM